MKKIILSLAGVMAATAFTPQAAAVPAFARQTGMACNSCHAQHFPTLSSFGRAFKADGFTMMGAQGKIEGEHLSIPDTLNAGILLKAQYRKTNGAQKVYVNSAGDTITTNDGKWMFPDEYGLFFGGRLADTGTLKVGTMIEHDMSALVGFRIPVVTDVGNVKLSVIPFTTDALGPFYGYTESSTGLNRAVRWNEHHADISAHRFVGVATGAASGFTFTAKSDMGYATLTRWAPSANMVDQSLSLNMLHVGVTPNIAGWDTVITGEVISGTSRTADTTALAFVDGSEYKATGLTAQSHGELGGLPTGLYATYANTPKSTATKTNAYNTSTTEDKKAFTIGADVSVIPNTLHIGAAYRNGKSTGKTDNALSLMATYDIAQNMALQITHSRYNGTKYDTAQPNGTQQTSFLLETAW